MSPTRLALFTAAFLALPLLTGCPVDPEPGEFDLSELPDGTYGEEYSGRIRILNYGGAVSLVITDGSLPDGLTMDEAGRVTGTPLYAGAVEIEVFASGMQGVEDFSGDVAFDITAVGVADAFLGYDHDQLNNFDQIGGRMRDIWLRPDGGGEDQSFYTLNPGIYLPGSNGQADRGRGDDVRIGDLASSELEWELGEWAATSDPQVHEYEPGILSQHVPEDDPPQIDTTAGTFQSGADGGEQDITITHPDFGTVETRLMIVSPDWCPNGEHEGGWQDGICE